MAPIIQRVAVLGATGQQGGAVAASLSQKGVEVVGITRNPDSEKAKALAAQPHTTVCQADLNDVESLKKAFEGCDGAFVIANFWEGMNVDTEMQHYANAAEALKATPSMKHIVFSTLEESVIPGVTDTDFKVLHEHKETGKMFVPHFDGKARAERYFDGLPVTFMVTSCYFENFTSFFTSYGNEDGSYTFTLPLSSDKQIPWTILPDLGNLAASAFFKPELIGQRIGQASFYATGDELAAILSESTGKKITYRCVPWETFAEFGFPGADELAQMFELWLRTHDQFCAARPLAPQEELMNCSLSDAVTYGKTFADKILFQEYQPAEQK